MADFHTLVMVILLYNKCLQEWFVADNKSLTL